MASMSVEVGLLVLHQMRLARRLVLNETAKAV